MAHIRTSLGSLLDLNVSILSQKLSLMEALISKHGHSRAFELYKSTCPIVGATMGQHLRHSMDHMELAALVVATAIKPANQSYYNEETKPSIPQLHYDLRVRGGTLEHNMDEAHKRIHDLSTILQTASKQMEAEAAKQKETPTSTTELKHNNLQHVQQVPSLHPTTTQKTPNSNIVHAHFMLSSNGEEFALPSTMERELGFCAHHAIHHMAMIRLIAIHHAQLDNLPHDFGRAPSTLHHDAIVNSS